PLASSVLAALALRPRRLVAPVARLPLLWSARPALPPRIAPRSLPPKIPPRPAVLPARSLPRPLAALPLLVAPSLVMAAA
ncbi:hypothetical protein C3R44_22215, partial [Mycobacterium tuberculosis]